MNPKRPTSRYLPLIVAILATTCAAHAHVMLDEPNGGEVIGPGTTTVIEWHILIGHPTIDWDLWYSVTGANGPWIEIVADLPPGDITTGAVHTYDWTVPDVESSQVRVRVRQDNSGTDYEDISDGDFTVTATIFVNGFESGTTGAWSAVVP